MASAGDPLELTRRRAEADALAAECERLRAARDLLTAHMSRLLPPADVSASFPGVADDHEASTVADEASETMSMASHAVSTMSHTTATTAVTAKSRGGKSQGGASRRSRRKKKSGRSSSAAAASARLSSRDRRVLASTEVEHLEKQIEFERVAEEKKLDALRASLEETNARTQSATKALFDFERDVVAASSVSVAAAPGAAAALRLSLKPSSSETETNEDVPSKSFVSAEKWCRHVDYLTASKRAECEQLALKTAACRARRRGLETSLRQKERAGERLTAVDHETLLIERNRRVERLELRNLELRRLAGVASRAADQLAKCKVELEEKSTEGQFLKADMAAKRVMIVSFDFLMIQVKAEHAKMAKINKDLHVAGSSGDNPPVGEYVRVKDAAHALEAKVKDAERKLELAKAKRRAAEAKNATRRLLGRSRALF